MWQLISPSSLHESVIPAQAGIHCGKIFALPTSSDLPVYVSGMDGVDQMVPDG
jgi:hypothetical protein